MREKKRGVEAKKEAEGGEKKKKREEEKRRREGERGVVVLHVMAIELNASSLLCSRSFNVTVFALIKLKLDVHAAAAAAADI